MASPSDHPTTHPRVRARQTVTGPAWVNGSPDENSDWTQCLPTLQRYWNPIFMSNRAFFLHLDFAPTGVNPLLWRVWGFEPTWPGYFLCCGLIDWLHMSGMVHQTPSESSWMQNGRPVSTPYHTPSRVCPVPGRPGSMDTLMKNLIGPSVFQPYKVSGTQFSGRTVPSFSISNLHP